MKKINIIFIIIICIGLFIPFDVFANEIERKTNFYLNVDYKFVLEDENNDNGNKKFTLYDKTKSLVFNSSYDNDGNYYYFNDMSDEDFSNIMSSFYSQIMNASSKSDAEHIMINNNIEIGSSEVGVCGNGALCEYRTEVWGHKVIPFILEETDLSTNKTLKKIVFFTYEIYLSIDHGHNWNGDINDYDIINIESGSNIYFTNYNLDIYASGWGENVESNVLFMRNAVFDYSDELWEELNNGPISSSEMSFDKSSILNIKDTDLSKPSIIQFNKKDDSKIDSNKKDNIIKKLVNPKTWTNGVIVLFMILIVVVGSSIFLIRKNNN